MQELIAPIEKWFAQGKQVALAMVVKIKDSAPRGPGSKMAVSSAGEMEGSVSGGCVEGAVVQEALEVIKSGKPKIIKYGISDEMAFSVGLTCGGTIEVLIRPFTQKDLVEARGYLASARFFAQATILTDGPRLGEMVSVYTDENLLAKLGLEEYEYPEKVSQKELFLKQVDRQLTLQKGQDIQHVFFNIYPLPSRMIIIGGVHTSISLVRLAKSFNFHTIIVDPRKAFANRQRFPDVDELIAEWPQDALPKLNLDEGCFVVTLSHDDKLDLPAAEIACRSTAHYIGMLSSRKNFARRSEELKASGITEQQLARIHTPVGLDIGARGPEEIALAILAEMVAARNGVDTH